MTGFLEGVESRRGLLARAAALLAVAGLSSAGAPVASAKDYASPLEALDEIDRLAAACGVRLGALRAARSSGDVLVARFLAALDRHRSVREDVRSRFALPRGIDPATMVGEADADLAGLRQALDDLMIAYAESLPVFGHSDVVSRLAVDMVEVSRLRTVIDLWVAAEGA